MLLTVLYYPTYANDQLFGLLTMHLAVLHIDYVCHPD